MSSNDFGRIDRKAGREDDVSKTIVSVAGRGVALAMGIAVIVINTLDTIMAKSTLTSETAISLVSIGLTALAIAALQKE